MDASNFTGRYDLAVIGAGSAGFSAAITAADMGANVALIGYGMIGGTCVNVGCVPSKALIRAAEVLHNASASARFAGIKASAEVTDWAALIAQKQLLVEDLRKAKYSDILPNYNNISYLEGKAVFQSGGGLKVDGQEISAAKIIIATGSDVSLPTISGIKDVALLNSTSVLELEVLPASMVFIGAGYIGVELAQLFARAGVEVTLVSRRGLLPEAEPEISAALSTAFLAEGIRLISDITYESISSTAAGIELRLGGKDGSQVVRAGVAVNCAGRAANIAGLNLQAAGIDINPEGGIKIDAYMQTSQAGIYAAGDVTGRDQFVYMAAYGAKLAAKNAIKGNSLAYDNSAMPSVVFSDPQVASVGLTEAGAKALGIEVKTSVLSLDNVPRALAARDTRGVIKLVADATSNKLIGAHIAAPEGADSIQTAVMAIKAGMTYQELAETIFPYLTTVEGLKLAAQTFDMDVAKLSCCAG